MMPDAKFEHCFGGHEPHVRKTRITLVPGAAVFSEQPSNLILLETHGPGCSFGACEVCATAEAAFNLPENSRSRRLHRYALAVVALLPKRLADGANYQ